MYYFNFLSYNKQKKMRQDVIETQLSSSGVGFGLIFLDCLPMFFLKTPLTMVCKSNWLGFLSSILPCSSKRETLRH